jgi:hypothetical protein
MAIFSRLVLISPHPPPPTPTFLHPFHLHIFLQESQLTEVNAMAVFSRLILISPQAFSALVAEGATQGLRAARDGPAAASLGGVKGWWSQG